MTFHGQDPGLQHNHYLRLGKAVIPHCGTTNLRHAETDTYAHPINDIAIDAKRRGSG